MPSCPVLSDISRGIRERYRGAQPGPREVYHDGEWGVYSRHLDDPSLDSVLIAAIPRSGVPHLWREANEHFGAKPVRVYVDDRELDAELRSTLEVAGCQRSCELVYLTHRGELPRVNEVPDLRIEGVTSSTVRDYEVVRTQAFSDCEDEPDAFEVAANAEARMVDLHGSCQLLIGRVGDVAAAIAGWYEGNDRLIFHLATRVPFRNRGIARHLLSHVIHETYEQRRRSVTILADSGDSPIRFYRRMGFTEEVYWQARYVYDPIDAPRHA